VFLKRVRIFCDSAGGLKDSYQEAAHKIGMILAESKVDLVYGGGCVGLMGILAEIKIKRPRIF